MSSWLWPLSLRDWAESALDSFCSVFFFLEPFGRPRFRFNGLTVGHQGSIKYKDNSDGFYSFLANTRVLYLKINNNYGFEDVFKIQTIIYNQMIMTLQCLQRLSCKGL